MGLPVGSIRKYGRSRLVLPLDLAVVTPSQDDLMKEKRARDHLLDPEDPVLEGYMYTTGIYLQ